MRYARSLPPLPTACTGCLPVLITLYKTNVKVACIGGRPAGSQVRPVKCVTHRRCQLEGPVDQHARMDLLRQRPQSPASCQSDMSSLPNEVLCKIFANLHLEDRQVMFWFLVVYVDVRMIWRLKALICPGWTYPPSAKPGQNSHPSQRRYGTPSCFHLLTSPSTISR